MQTTSPVRHVPQAPALVVLLAVCLAVMAWRLYRGGHFTWSKAATGVIACLYLVAVAREVFQPFEVKIDHRYFPGWRAFIHLTPLHGTEPSDILLNALLFLPSGMLLPLLTRARSLRHVTLLGLLLSLCIETSQLLLDLTVSDGHIADVNDLLGNTVGAFAGALALRVMRMNPRVRRLTNASAWQALSPKPVAGQNQRHVDATPHIGEGSHARS